MGSALQTHENVSFCLIQRYRRESNVLCRSFGGPSVDDTDFKEKTGNFTRLRIVTIMQMSFSEAVFPQTKELCVCMCTRTRAADEAWSRLDGFVCSFRVGPFIFSGFHPGAVGVNRGGSEPDTPSLKLITVKKWPSPKKNPTLGPAPTFSWRGQRHLRYSDIQEEAEEPVSPVSELFTVKQTWRKWSSVCLTHCCFEYADDAVLQIEGLM